MNVYIYIYTVLIDACMRVDMRMLRGANYIMSLTARNRAHLYSRSYSHICGNNIYIWYITFHETSMIFQVNSRIFINYQQCQRNLIKVHQVPLTYFWCSKVITNFHWCSFKFGDIRRVSLISIDVIGSHWFSVILTWSGLIRLDQAWSDLIFHSTISYRITVL